MIAISSILFVSINFFVLAVIMAMRLHLVYGHFQLVLCFSHTINTTATTSCQRQCFVPLQTALCYLHCAFIIVLTAVCFYAVLAQLDLIQGNSRCFGAHCKMSRNTRFLCYYFGLKYSSVLFFTLFPSLLTSNIWQMLQNLKWI